MWWETVKHGSERREGEITSTYSTICNHSDQNKINIYMQDAVVNKIKSKIAHGKLGEVSFPQYDVEYVTKLLAISQ